MMKLLNKLNNAGTFLGLIGLITLLANQFISVDAAWIEETAQIIASILVLLGIMNNPDNTNLIK